MIRAKTSLLIAGGAAVALAGCVDSGAYDRGERTRTQDGALIGAGIGAILGASAEDDDRLKNAAIGAAIGAGAGALVGNSLDRQAADLRRDIGNDNIDIVNTGSELIVTMPQDILFATDSATLRSDLRRDLRTVARNLQSYPNTNIDVIGHTDDTGDAGYNQNLSTRRANAVASVLLEEGVSSRRIRAYGRGEQEPVASNLTAQGRALNRRVEIIISPAA